MVTTAAGPDGILEAGKSYDVPDETAATWVVRKHAKAVDPIPQKLIDAATAALQKEIDAAKQQSARERQAERASLIPPESAVLTK